MLTYDVRRLRWVALMAVTLVGSAAGAATLASPGSAVVRSRWRSTYGDYGGHFVVNAPLSLSGGSGRYTPGGGSGVLSDVYYRRAASGGVQVAGSWSYAGQSGWFVFVTSPDGSTFTGKWGRNGQRAAGFWNGRRAGSG
jgi:hypothetical protein